MSAHVQALGSFDTSSAATTTVLSISKTVTLGNIIIVGWGCYFTGITVSGITDNLGNVYVKSERVTTAGNGATSDLWYAPVTVGGTLTTITVTHTSTSYRDVIASEFSGVGAFSEAGGGVTGTSNVATGVSSKTIPANGLAVWFVQTDGGAVTHVAGDASGSPSTTPALSLFNSAGGVAGTPNSLCYALADGSDVTSFTGATGLGSTQGWAGAGGLFAAPLATFLPHTSPYPSLLAQ